MLLVHNGNGNLTVGVDLVDGDIHLAFAACHDRHDSFSRRVGRGIVEGRMEKTKPFRLASYAAGGLDISMFFRDCAQGRQNLPRILNLGRYTGSDFKKDVFYPIIHRVMEEDGRRNLCSVIRDIVVLVLLSSDASPISCEVCSS